MEELATSWFNDRLVIAMAALLLNAALMGPRRIYRKLGIDRPARYVTSALRLLEHKLNRDKRSASERAFRGNLLVVGFVLATALAGGALSFALSFSYYGSALHIVMVTFLLSLRQSADFISRIANTLEKGDIAEARSEFVGTPWRNAAVLDGYGLARAAAETSAVNFTEKIVSPVMWFVLLGLPGLFASRMVTALNDAAGEPSDAFGLAIARAGWVVHYIPSLLSGFLLCLGAMFLPFCKPTKALRAWALAGFAYAHHRRQVAVIGAALNLALGGPLSAYAPGEWVGGTVARAFPRDARRSLILLWVASFLLLFLMATILA